MIRVHTEPFEDLMTACFVSFSQFLVTVVLALSSDKLNISIPHGCTGRSSLRAWAP